MKRLAILIALALLAAPLAAQTFTLHATAGNVTTTKDPMVPTSGTLDPYTSGPVEVVSSFIGEDGVVYVEGLDADGYHFAETVTISGVEPTSIQGGADVLRVNRMQFQQSTPELQNGGNITARKPGTVLPRSQIFGQRGASEWSTWAVARDREATLLGLTVTNWTTGTVRGRVTLWKRPWGGTWYPVTTLVPIATSPNVFEELNEVIPPGWEIKLAAETSGGTSNITATLIIRQRRL